MSTHPGALLGDYYSKRKEKKKEKEYIQSGKSFFCIEEKKLLPLCM
jgi:hypothetical protein